MSEDKRETATPARLGAIMFGCACCASGVITAFLGMMGTIG